MNTEQVKSAIRSIILALAAGVGGYGVGKNWYSAEQLALFINSEFFGGVVVALITAGYGIFMNKSDRLQTAAAGVNPESVTIAPKAIADASPASNVVAVGSPAAKIAAIVTPSPDVNPTKKVTS